LLGNDEFAVDSSSGKIKHKKLNNDRERHRFEDAPMAKSVEWYTEEVKRVFTSLSNVFDRNIEVEMTGGLDTRTVFASLNSVGGYTDFSYGLSGNALVGQLDGDLNVVKQLAKTYDRRLRLMNWEDDGSIDEIAYEEYFDKYGFDFVTYGCSRNYFNEYERRKTDTPTLLLNGYFGETIKAREWLDYRWEDPIPISKTVYKYFIYNWVNDNIVREKKHWKKFKRFFGSQFIGQGKENYNLPIKGERVHKSEFDELRWMADRYGDSIVTNLHNQFAYCLSPLGDGRLFDKALEIPYKYRRHNIFQFEVIKYLDRPVISIPLFSHCNYRKVNGEALIKEKLIFQKLVSQYLTRLYREAYLYRKRSKHGDDPMIQEYKRYIRSNSFLDEYLDVSRTFDPILLSYMVMYSYGINRLGVDSIE
jgi:hypothetical protein